MNMLASFVPLVGGGCVVVGLLLWVRSSWVCDEMVRTLVSEGTGKDACGPERESPFASVKFDRVRAWIVGALVVGGLTLFLKHGTLALFILYLALGCLAGELVYRGRLERARRELSRRLEFYLPTAMERVVMAVGAGLDIIPALSEAARRSEDPVSDIFRSIVSLSEGGLRVEHAIQMTADTVSSSPVKHALAHLALAYKQGGEVVRPLKELSDATQTQYQESVEEEIAKLPVRAVLPLMLTFTGLIICFLTVPVVQVGASLEKFSHATK